MSLYALSPLTSLSWMCAISDLAKPECSIAWTADTKMDVMLASPFAVAILIVSYGLSKWFIHHKDPSTNSHDLVFKCEAMSVGIFFVGSSFLLKGMLGGFDCSTDLTNGKDYLDIDPGIECWGDEHTSIRNKAAIGLTMWCVILASISCRFLSDGGKYRYSFLTTKLEDRWFWWELFLLARKILIMACGLFNTRHTARGWYCGSLVIIVALAVHAYARPYKDSLVDFCESASLMSTLIIFQSGMIFNSSIDHTGLLSWFLEKLSIFLVLAVATLGLLSQADALIQNAHDSVHFSKQFVQRRSRGSLRKACAQLGIGLELLRPDHALDKQIPPKVKEMSERLSNLGPQSLVNSCCAFWTFEEAELLLLTIRRLPEEVLSDLLFLERAKRGKKNFGVKNELERQLMAARVLKSPVVLRLAENIKPAHHWARSLAHQLASPQEFEEAIKVLERTQKDGDIRQTLWRRMCCCQALRESDDSSQRRSSDSTSEDHFENPVHGGLDSDDSSDAGDDQQPDPRKNERSLAASKEHLSVATLDSLAKVDMLAKHLADVRQQVMTGSQTITELSLAAERSTRLINEMMSTVIVDNTIEAVAGTCGGKKKKGNLNLEIRSVHFGPGSAVTIDRSKSGRNALALFGTIIEEEGKEGAHRKGVRHHKRPTQGRAYGSKFEPYDFSTQPEELVLTIDGREHTVEFAVNLPNVQAAVALLHVQPWIQRSRKDEDLPAASAATVALAQKLTDEDPVGDDEPGAYMGKRCGCCSYNRLPRSLQTTAAVRRHRRFDTAILTLVHELHQRFIDINKGVGHSHSESLAVVAMRLNASTRRMDDVEGALELSNAGNNAGQVLTMDLDLGAAGGGDEMDEAANAIFETVDELSMSSV